MQKKENKKKKDKHWADFIKDRANYACEVCGSYNKIMNAHHIIPKRGYPNLRWDVKNGICLCAADHKFAKTSAHNNGVWFTLWLEKNRPETLAYLKSQLTK